MLYIKIVSRFTSAMASNRTISLGSAIVSASDSHLALFVKRSMMKALFYGLVRMLEEFLLCEETAEGNEALLFVGVSPATTY